MINGPMDKVSRGPRDNGTNGQRVIRSTQGQSLLKKNGQFELVSEEGPSCCNQNDPTLLLCFHLEIKDKIEAHQIPKSVLVPEKKCLDICSFFCIAFR